MIITHSNGAANAVRRVYLDGKALSLVIRADDEAGVVVRYVQGEDGKPKLVGDEFATITETGKVEIELNNGWRYNTVTQQFALLPKHLLH
jgi:hypothetical protein